MHAIFLMNMYAKISIKQQAKANNTQEKVIHHGQSGLLQRWSNTRKSYAYYTSTKGLQNKP